MSAISPMMPSQQAPTHHQRPYSVADFLAFGKHHGIAYRFPTLSTRHQPDIRQAVVHGQVEELELRDGLRLTSSDLDVLQHYESTSLQPAPLFITVVLDGTIRVRSGDRDLRLVKGMAFSTRLEDTRALHVLQPPGQHLQTLNLAFGPEALNGTSRQGPMITAYLATMHAPSLHHWQVPSHLLSALTDALRPAWPHDLRLLLLEGLALQLLAHGLQTPHIERNSSQPMSPSEWRRLCSVRQALHDSPAHSHTLQGLAAMAAMSPSSLRHKFRLAFGQSVFDYLRERRLTQAREYLRQGFSVQQAAHLVGYRHSTNFATAFRRHFGMAPSSML